MKAAKRVSKQSQGTTLEEKVKKAVPSIWTEIMADVDWEVTIEDAAELCLDADRPVSFGYMSKEDYAELLKLPIGLADDWAEEALKGFFQ